MVTALSALPPTVLVVDLAGGPGAPSAPSRTPVTYASAALQDTGANIPPPVLYDQFGRSVFEITDRHGTFTNALTLGYRWLV